jgi:hypothetical protein
MCPDFPFRIHNSRNPMNLDDLLLVINDVVGLVSTVSLGIQSVSAIERETRVGSCLKLAIV